MAADASRQTWLNLTLLAALSIVCALLWLDAAAVDVVTTKPLLSEEVGFSGPEIHVVFIGASDCAASQADWMPEALADMRQSVSRAAAELGGQATFAGVALDSDPAAGLRFLNRMGSFHELSLGRSWLNSQSIQFLLREHAAEAAIPQIAVFLRHIDREGEFIEVSEDRLIERRIGIDEIRSWMEGGFRLRTLGS